MSGQVTSIDDVRVVTEPLDFGWGRMGEKKRSTSKAILFDYHGRDLWIAKKNLVIWDGGYHAKTFAIDSAKRWAEEQRTK